MAFSEYLSAAKGAVEYVQSHVRYRGMNAGGGWNREALTSQTGNCCELSAVVFRRLQQLGIRPIEFFAVYRGS